MANLPLVAIGDRVAHSGSRRTKISVTQQTMMLTGSFQSHFKYKLGLAVDRTASSP
jgi:hypothetical protein